MNKNLNDNWVDPALHNLQGWSGWQYAIAWLAALLLMAIVVVGSQYAANRQMEVDRRLFAGGLAAFGFLTFTWLIWRIARHTESAATAGFIIVAALGVVGLGVWLATEKPILAATCTFVAVSVLFVDDMLKRLAAPIGLSVVGLLVIVGIVGLMLSKN